MTGTTYACTSCAQDTADDRASGALQHCEVCGNWVPAPRSALAREFVPTTISA